MRRVAPKATSWVVYKKIVRGQESPLNAICEKGEWDAMEMVQPGFHTLVQAGLGSEGEAEQVARGTSGDRPVPVYARKLPRWVKAVVATPQVLPAQPAEQTNQEAGSFLIPICSPA